MAQQDGVLLERWQRQRDVEAFTELVGRYSSLVYSTCARVLGDRGQAEEVAQECFVELMQTRQPVRVSLGAWLHTLATRRTYDRIRQEARRRNRETQYAAAQPAGVEGRDAEVAELLARVDEVIAALPGPLHDVLVGRFLEGRTHAEMARAWAVSESAVRQRLEKAVAQTREGLRLRGVQTSAAALVAALAGASEAAPAALLTRMGKLALGQPMPGWVAGGAGALLAKLAVVAAIVVAGFGAFTLFAGPPSERVVANAVLAAEPAGEVRGAPEAALPEVSLPAPTPPPATEAPVSARAQAPVGIHGRVYDAATDAGIAGAVLEAAPQLAGAEKITSEPANAEGVYGLPDLPAGSYRLKVLAIPQYPQRVGQESIMVEVEAGKAHAVDFPLKRGVPISGVVVDAAGNPGAGAVVGAIGLNLPNAVKTTAGADGTFVLFLEEAMPEVVLQARTDGAESVPTPGVLVSMHGLAEQRLVLTEPRSGGIGGVIVNPEGAPVPWANVYLMHKTHRPFPHAGNTHSNAQGEFKFSGCAPGDYAVIVTEQNANGFSTSDEKARILLAAAEEVLDLEVVFGDAGGLTISGVVQDASGDPVQQAEVHFFGQGKSTAHTDKQGLFKIGGLENRRYHFEVMHFDYMGAFGEADAGDEGVEVVLEKGGTVSGMVVRAEDGKALEEFTVGGQVQRSAEGRFTLDRVPPGETTVTASAPGYAPSKAKLTVAAGKTAEVRLALVAAPPFNGVVVDGAGQPVGDAIVYLGNGGSLDQLQRAAVTRSAADGTYSISSMPPDAERVCAWRTGYGAGVAVVPGNGRIVLPAPAVIEGAITTPDADYVDYFAATYYPEAMHLPRQQTQSIGVEGTFRLDHLSPGTVEINARRNMDRYSITHQLQLEAGQQYALRFDFAPGTAQISGTITQAGEPAGSAQVEVEHVEAGARHRLHDSTDNDGKFTFQEVWEGPVTLRVSQRGEEVEARTLEVGAGESQSLELTLGQ